MHKTLLLLCAAAGCAMSEEDDLSTIESLNSVEQWDDGLWVDGDQRSNYQVALASYGGELHMVYRSDNQNGLMHPELKWSRFNGSSWSEPVLLPTLKSDRGPSMTAWDGKLVVVYNSYNENRFLMSTSLDGLRFGAPVTAGTSLYTATVGELSPSVVNYRNVLYLAYCKFEEISSGVVRGSVQIDKFNGYEWSSAANFPAGGCKSVAAAALPGPKFRLIFNTFNPSTGIWAVNELSGTGVTQELLTSRTLANEYSAKPSAIAYCNGVTHWLHGGQSDPESMWWSFFENGQWVRSVRVPHKFSYGGAQVACHNGRAIMVHNQEDVSLLRTSTYGL